MNARELRVWHWRRYEAACKTFKSHEMEAKALEAAGGSAAFHRERMKAADRRATFHHAAVDVLDTHPECVAAGTRAYQDDAVLPDPNLRIRKPRNHK